jgi:hypothetical protein
VLANAVIHIRNRDTRLLAAATVFMRNMTVMQKERGMKLDHPAQILPLVIFPVFLPLIFIFGFLIQLAFRIGYGSRAVIGISREMIADAEAVRLTHNPAALASALHRIEQRSAVADFRDEHAAMLVFGVTHGPLATHPTLEERIGALARTTGSMVLDTSRRLDTRAGQPSKFGRSWKLDPGLERIATLALPSSQRGFWGAVRSAKDPDRNIFGLNRRGLLIVALSLVGTGILYQDALRRPDRLTQLFDLATARKFSGLGSAYAHCMLADHRSPSDNRALCEQGMEDAWRLFDHLPGERPAHREESLTFSESAHPAAQPRAGAAASHRAP